MGAYLPAPQLREQQQVEEGIKMSDNREVMLVNMVPLSIMICMPMYCIEIKQRVRGVTCNKVRKLEFKGHLLCKIHFSMYVIHKHVSPLCKEILKVSGKKICSLFV